jgi:hypothetical protein
VEEGRGDSTRSTRFRRDDMELENDLNEPGPRAPGARDSAVGAADTSDGEMRGHPAVVLGILVVVLAALLAYFGLRLIPR